MRVIVDEGLCQANGLCMQVAPEVFHMGDDDEVVSADDSKVEDHAREVEQAVEICPIRALRLER